jgi:hypothetical protein
LALVITTGLAVYAAASQLTGAAHIPNLLRKGLRG